MHAQSSVTLYGADYSVYTRIARLALEEKGIVYALEPVDIFSAAGPGDAYLERHPFARIPSLAHGDFALYEAGAIARYVDEAFEGPRLQPDDARSRARMNQIVSIMDSYGFGALVWDVFFERVRAPQHGRAPDEARIRAGLEISDKCLAALDRLQGRNIFLASHDFSLADLHAYPMITLFRMAPEGASLLDYYPDLAAWYRRIHERDSVMSTRHPLETTNSI